MMTLKNVSRRLPSWILPTSARVVFQFLHGWFVDYGWFRSLRAGRPMDRNGEALPWITYPAIDFIAQFDLRTKRVFEWGAGNSTRYFSRRSLAVVSVETEAAWFEEVRRWELPNVKILLRPRDPVAYLAPIGEEALPFDVIVIDGPGDLRPGCARTAVKFLAPGGMILLDNSDQSPLTASILRQENLIEIDFSGWAPGAGYPQTTSIFLDRTFSFPTLGSVQPQPSVAQPNPPWPDA